MYGCCYGIRLNDSYQELTCEYRERCPYFIGTDLRNVIEHPSEYVLLDTYNDRPCELAPADEVTARDIPDNPF